MPYRKPRYQRRRRRRKQNISYGDIGSKVYNDVLTLKKLINVEYKSLTQALDTTPDTTGNVHPMCAIAQGDDFDDRNGRKIRLKSIRLKGSIIAHASSVNSRTRLCLVRDNNGNTTAPAITDLFNTVLVFSENKNKIGDPQSNARFSVLWDELFITSLGNENSIVQFDKYLDLDSHCYFTGTATTDEGKGHLYLFTASNEATNVPAMTADAQVKWIDN